MTTQTEQELRDLLQSLKYSKPNAWERIPQLFRSLRNEAEMTQTQVAETVGITHNAICMIEAGKPAVSIDKLEQMIEAMVHIDGEDGNQ